MLNSILPSGLLLLLFQQSAAPTPSVPASTETALPREPLHVYAVGDLNLGRAVTWQYLLKGDTLYPFKALRDTLASADILFGNLESPIAPAGHAYEQAGSYVFSAPPVAADALNWAGFDVVSSANNHAWDAGLDGVVETVQQLDRVGIAHVGTGITLDAAHQAAVIERKGWRVAFLGATHAFNPAPDSFYSHPGSRYVAWADSGWLYPEIRRLKERHAADIVVVSVHGGQELSDSPDRSLRNFFRGAIDAGADICLGHHPHVLQSVEWYRGKPLVYSMGNFIFRQGAPWTGLSGVFEFTVEPDGAITLDLLPVRASYQATLVTGAAADSVRHRTGMPGPPPRPDLEHSMSGNSIDFLKRLLDSPGPSGFEAAPARVWREETKRFAEDVRADAHGNSVAAVNPKGSPRLMLAGHIDEIGLQITHIDDEGYCYFAGIGGWDSQVLVGQRVVVVGPKGQVRGVIGKKPPHLMKKEEFDKVSQITDLWIDIGAATRAEALERVHVGDPAVIDAQSLEFAGERIVSRSIDNRIGAYVVAEALRLLAKDRPRHAAVFAVATTREEIAYTGGGARTSAVGIDPQVALVVDVTHSTDWPGADKKQGGDHKLGGGPVFSRGSATSALVFDLLVRCADEEKIPYTVQAAPRDTGTDADAIHNALRGIPTGLVSVPNRYMHSPNEMVSLIDVERSARLLAAVARKLTPDVSFIPS